MQVRKWMTREVLTVGPRDSLLCAQRLLEEHRIDQLPVVVADKLVGLLTKRDLHDALESAREVAGRSAPGPELCHLSVEEVMTPHVLTVQPEDSIIYAARLLRRERIGCLPVVQGHRLVGILTRCDLLDALTDILAGKGRANPAEHGEPELEACSV